MEREVVKDLPDLLACAEQTVPLGNLDLWYDNFID